VPSIRDSLFTVKSTAAVDELPVRLTAPNSYPPGANRYTVPVSALVVPVTVTATVVAEVTLVAAWDAVAVVVVAVPVAGSIWKVKLPVEVAL
jgi:hypothetical protein